MKVGQGFPAASSGMDPEGTPAVSLRGLRQSNAPGKVSIHSVPSSQIEMIQVLLVTRSEASGVPVVVQWLTNPTRNHEVAGWIPALAQWVKDPALP